VKNWKAIISHCKCAYFLVLSRPPTVYVKMPSMFHSVEKMRLTHLILFWFIFPSVIKCLSQRNCPPTLTDTIQNHIVICTTNSHSNRRNSLYIDVEFEAFPKPNVTWILNKHVGQEKVIYPGDRSRGYRSFQLRQDVRKSLFFVNLFTLRIC